MPLDPVTPFGNDATNISVSIVGQRVYIENFHASSVEDPRFLINPSLKSGVFDLELNDTFSYADVTIPYDPAKVTYTANLSVAYFNGTSGNYTFVSSTVDTVNQTVTPRVSGSGIFSQGASFAALDRLKYQALPGPAQTEMGYIDISAVDNWTIHDGNVVSSHTTLYYNGLPFPPGNYTVLPSGYYSHMWVMDICPVENHAYQNYNGLQGPYARYTGPSGETTTKVSSLIEPGDSNHRIRFTHYGGPTGIYISGLGGPACGDLYYTIYYGDGPAFSEDYNATELENNEFNATETGYDLAVTAYQAAAGCVLGQAGKKGGMLDGAHNLIPGWNSAITDDVTESPAYLVGHVACGIAFPYASLARDFTADMMRGDYAGAALQSLGYLGSVRNIFATTDVIPAFIAKHPQKVDSGQEIMNHLWRQGIYHLELPLATKVGMLDNAFEGAVTRLNGNHRQPRPPSIPGPRSLRRPPAPRSSPPSPHARPPAGP